MLSALRKSYHPQSQERWLPLVSSGSPLERKSASKSSEMTSACLWNHLTSSTRTIKLHDGSRVMISFSNFITDDEIPGGLYPNYAFLVTKKLRQRGISLIVGSSSSGKFLKDCNFFS